MAPFNHQSGKRYGGLRLEPVQKPAAWRRLLRALELEPEDLLAIPLCLVLGLAFTLYSIGASGLLMAFHGAAFGSPGDTEAVAKVVTLVSAPLSLVRQLFS